MSTTQGNWYVRAEVVGARRGEASPESVIYLHWHGTALRTFSSVRKLLEDSWLEGLFLWRTHGCLLWVGLGEAQHDS